MTTTMVCGRCKEPIASGAGEYTREGELLCGKCLAITRVGAAEAIEAASKRKVRIMAGVIVPMIFLVPGVLFAVGAGPYVFKAMLGLALVMWLLSWFALKQIGGARRGTLAPAMRRYYWRVFLALFFGALFLMLLTGILAKVTKIDPGF